MEADCGIEDDDFEFGTVRGGRVRVVEEGEAVGLEFAEESNFCTRLLTGGRVDVGSAGFDFAVDSDEDTGLEAERAPVRWAVRKAGEGFAEAWEAPLMGGWRWREVVVMLGPPSTTMSGRCGERCRLPAGGL